MNTIIKGYSIIRNCPPVLLDIKFLLYNSLGCDNKYTNDLS